MSKPKADLAQIVTALERVYGAQTPCGPSDPYQMVVYLNCGYPATDVSCSKGYEALKREAGLKPEQLLAVPKAKLTRLMRTGGIVPDARAKRLKEIAEMVIAGFDGDLKAALEKLLKVDKASADQGLKAAKKALKEFPVVGEPSADKILLFSNLVAVAAVPSASVDVPIRIFIGKPGKNYATDYRVARQILDAGLENAFEPRQKAYLLFKKHGQEICKRSKPKCEICPLTAQCAYLQAKAMDGNSS